MSTFSQLNYLLDKKAKRQLVGLFIMMFIGSFAELLGVTIILPIINLAMYEGDLSNKWYCKVVMDITGSTTKEAVILWFIAIAILIYILKNAYLCLMYRIQYKIAVNIRMNFSTKLMSSYLKQPYSYFLNVNSSDLIRGVTSDVDQLYQLVNNIFTVASNGITAITIVTYLAISNIWMTLTITMLLGICLCIIVFGLQKINRRNGREAQYLAGQMNKHLKQAFEGIKETKIMNTEKHFINVYRDTYKKNADITVKNSLISTLPKYLIEVFAMISILGFLGINIVLNDDYVSVIPQLAVFCVAAYKLLPSVNALYASFNMIIYYKASIDLVYRDIKEADQFKDTFEDMDNSYKDMKFEESIELKEVSFKYPEADRFVIEKSSLEILKGSSVALVGPSGGGKTTTADIILALLEPTDGIVTVDGVDINSNIWGWKKKLGYIPQSIYLIDDTIKANVAFGINKDDINEEEVWRSLEDAQLKDYVQSLPDGLDTQVGERGVRISGGQRQRIGIARALYRNPEVLVFDEATSALDNETEREVMKAIDSLQGTKTILMIAHRLSTIEKCDAVYRVENGMIVKER